LPGCVIRGKLVQLLADSFPPESAAFHSKIDFRGSNVLFYSCFKQTP
jgi:hypothetical protein